MPTPAITKAHLPQHRSRNRSFAPTVAALLATALSAKEFAWQIVTIRPLIF
ncbi:hypothetical protein D082_21880 [Synechocystis sp. PCC 6714]|nr:hypothetical protein D082_21880 [Synechocystis sp. PCC 6714]